MQQTHNWCIYEGSSHSIGHHQFWNSLRTITLQPTHRSGPPVEGATPHLCAWKYNEMFLAATINYVSCCIMRQTDTNKRMKGLQTQGRPPLSSGTPFLLLNVHTDQSLRSIEAAEFLISLCAFKKNSMRNSQQTRSALLLECYFFLLQHSRFL
jgi:hypothetical protein